MPQEVDRRTFAKWSVLTSAGAALAANSAVVDAAEQTPQASTWTGKLGKLNLSRLMLGGNLLHGNAHARDLKYVRELMSRYNTPEKIMETLALAEKQGINSINTSIHGSANNLVREYRKKHGDKMKWIVAVYAVPMSDQPFAYIDQAVREGADAIYLWGVASDGLVKQKNMDLMKRTVERMRRTGLPIGIGAHTARVIVASEKAKLDVDFYMKTFHTRSYASAQRPEETGDLGAYDNAWCTSAEEVVEIMKNVQKAWIAFKVMAAGAISPKEAFTHAFNSGADFVLAGMLDFQIEEDVRIAKDALANVRRTRPWRG
jgi:hypothetical protein